MAGSIAVLVMDMFHYRDPEHETIVEGFPSLEAATEYARRRTRDSLEVCRENDQSKEELKRAWYAFGEACLVIGGDYAGSHELDFSIDNPASAEDRCWMGLAQRSGIN